MAVKSKEAVKNDEVATETVVDTRPIHLRATPEKVTIKLYEPRCRNARILQKKIFRPLFNSQKGHWETGLTDEEEVELSKLVGASLSKYSVDLPEYYQQPIGKFTIDSDPVELISTNINDFIKIKFLRADHRIANSESELVDNQIAMYYIYSEELEKKQSAERLTRKKKAYDFIDEPFAVKRSAIEVFENKSYEKGDEALINQRIEVAIEGDNLTGFLDIISRSSDEVGIDALIVRAVNKNIFQTDEKGKYYYMDEFIGANRQDVIRKLLNPDFAQKLSTIKQKLSF